MVRWVVLKVCRFWPEYRDKLVNFATAGLPAVIAGSL